MKAIKEATREQLETIALMALRNNHAPLYGDDFYKQQAYHNLSKSFRDAGIDQESFMEWEDRQLTEVHPELLDPFNIRGEWKERGY